MIVLKFGGTSVGDGAAIVRAADIIGSRRDRQPVVVVSAMAGVTDRLLDAARLAAEGDLRSALAVSQELRDKHETAINEAVCKPKPRSQAAEVVATHFAGLDLLLEALTLLREDGPKAGDAVLSHGELWSSEIVARALEARDLPGQFVDARQVMITDATFGRAVPDRDVIAERARVHLSSVVRKGGIPVTQGFVGATLKGTPTTIGRGGSDYTAALLGAALAAEEVEIWTDVDGLMTADPRVVKAARTLPEASYDEAAELAYFGAKVLHPATIVPLVERGIPVWIKNSRRPEVAGTKIVAKAARADHTVKSIAWKRGLTILNLRAPRMLGTHGFLKAMFDVFERHGTAVDVVTTSEVSVSVSLENGAPPAALLSDLGGMGELTVARERTIICVVGEGLRDTPGIPARILKALDTVPVEMISLGASKINLTFVVQDQLADAAVRRLHEEFYPVKVAIVGVGKMGLAIRDLARTAGDEVVAELDIGQLTQSALNGADVAIEFTQPDAAAENLVALAAWKVPTVSGTTGWYGRLPEVRAAFEKSGAALVYAPNFSVGVQLLLQVARSTGQVLASRPEFDVQLIDTHHKHKKDAPSGTALALRDALRAVDPKREYPITSIREGEVPGTHEIRIESPGETITLEHAASDRTPFARGALVAANWLTERPRKGVFSFDQVLFGKGG